MKTNLIWRSCIIAAVVVDFMWVVLVTLGSEPFVPVPTEFCQVQSPEGARPLAEGESVLINQVWSDGMWPWLVSANALLLLLACIPLGAATKRQKGSAQLGDSSFPTSGSPATDSPR